MDIRLRPLRDDEFPHFRELLRTEYTAAGRLYASAGYGERAVSMAKELE